MMHIVEYIVEFLLVQAIIVSIFDGGAFLVGLASNHSKIQWAISAFIASFTLSVFLYAATHPIASASFVETFVSVFLGMIWGLLMIPAYDAGKNLVKRK